MTKTDARPIPFETRLTRTPRPFDPACGAEALAHFPSLPPALAELISGAAGCSPYLARLMEQEAPWLSAAFDDPEAARDDVITRLGTLPNDQLGGGLREAKRRIALLAGLADLGGVWCLEEVTQALTALADAATDAALRNSVAAEARRGKLPGMDEAIAHETAGHVVALAMGKMGAFELNYSSDIDLICLFDDSRYDQEQYLDARAALIRATRKMAALLSDVTAQGYVFRTDLRLRPDPAVTPVCVPMSGAESYYESMGRTWERAAYIKARPAAGDLEAGAEFLGALTPFVWRKHLDFAAIQDAHDMRLRIREHKGLGGAISVPGHDMKLGRGGIREIEFFTQTRQIIAGGRDVSLRCRGTVAGLAALAQAGWITPDLAEKLTGHYRFHREVEHRLQMIQDAQTQSLPTRPEELDRLAAFMGRDRAELEKEIGARLAEVHALTEDFFAPDAAPSPTSDRTAPGPEAEARLSTEVLDRWPTYPALRSDRAMAIFHRLRPGLLAGLASSDHPEEALSQFDGFLRGLPAGVQLFSLFEANPQLLQLIVDICAAAPALASYLSRNASVLDAVIGGSFFEAWPELDTLRATLERPVAAAADYEAQLDALRREMKEWHFRIGVHQLRGLIDAETAGAQYSQLAEAVLQVLTPRVIAEFAQKHGPPPGRGLSVLGMGSLGAGRLHAQSDLDLIVIYDPDGVDSSDGPRPLQTRPYYARLTQALITALKAPMAQGTLYDVDMRLRPSGRQGPVATSLASFMAYQRDEAWTWEHLALTRARPMAGSDALGADVEAFRQSFLKEPRPADKIRQDTAEMRARLASAKPGTGPWEVKQGPGRLQDIELLAEGFALQTGATERGLSAQLALGLQAGLLNAAEATALNDAARLFWHVQCTARLLTGGAPGSETLGPGSAAHLVLNSGFETTEALHNALTEHAANAARIVGAQMEHKG